AVETGDAGSDATDDAPTCCHAPSRFAALRAASASSPRAEMSSESTDGGAQVLLDGKLFAGYATDRGQQPSVWPIIGPSGHEMTRSLPLGPARPAEKDDHPHHRSLWFAHGDVNGHDFWHGAKADARYPRIDVVTGPHTLRLGSADTPSELTLWSETWSAAENEPLLKASVSLATEMRQRTRILTYVVELTALTDVTFGDTKEGTFAMRLRPELRLRGDVARGKARGADGTEGRNLWGKRNLWVTYHGPVQTAEGNEIHVGVALFDHPENPRHPTWWHARDYGLVAANPFGVHDFEKKPAGTGDLKLAKDGSMTLRYRIALYTGEPDLEQLKTLWSQWARSNQERPSQLPQGKSAKGDESNKDDSY
ncbi:MAG: PmoA family protein, partial [Planctomycetota bacterium]